MPITYKYIGDFKGYSIEQRSGIYCASCWDANINAPNTFYRSKSLTSVKRKIVKALKRDNAQHA